MDFDRAYGLLLDFFESGATVHCKRKEIIVNSDNKPDHAYRIVKGQVAVQMVTKSGEMRITYLLREGEIFPSNYIFGIYDNSLEYMAFSDAVLKKKSMANIHSFMEKEPYSVFWMARQQAIAYSRIINLSLGSAEERIAYRLLRLAERFGEPKDDYIVINLVITIQDLANTVRLTRETTGKVIDRFESQGIVTFGRRQIIVYPEKLKAYED